MEISRDGTVDRGRSSSAPLVSVVIPTTDKELKMAEFCRETIENSSYGNVEVLIVNEGRERSEQRNLGIKWSKGKYIMYLDSDQFVSNELIKECVYLMEEGYNGVYIPETIVTPGWFGRLRNYERQFYTGTPIDCVRFFKRRGCPRFSTELHGPEDSLHDRQIKEPKAVAKNVVYHEDGITFFDYFKKKAYYSKSMKKYAELSPDDKCLNFWWRCFGVFIENGKWKRFLRHPIKSTGVMIMIFLRGIIYLINR
jgi:glycosyltransferase involved in cell wall biosynthesis